jgi:hypothetical protein
MCVCVYTCTYQSVQILSLDLADAVQSFLYICIVCMRVLYACMYCMYVCTYVCVVLCELYVLYCMYVLYVLYVCMYVCMYVCVDIYKFRYTWRENRASYREYVCMYVFVCV